MNSIIFKRAGALILSSAITLSLLPKVTGNSEVKADEWVKSIDNTRHGVLSISNPVAPTGKDSSWQGNYVYFGNNNGDPIKFRVLSKNTEAYGGKTLFLDCDQLFDKQKFDDDSNVWADSDLRKYFNGEYLEKHFTSAESNSILESTVGSHDYSNDIVPMQEDIIADFKTYTPLDSDKVFALDYEDVSNPLYGYHKEDGANHKKTIIDPEPYDQNVWWLRSDHKDKIHHSKTTAISNVNGTLIVNPCDAEHYASPALNIDLDSILFSSLVSGESGKSGAEYKLTLKDDEIKLDLNNTKEVTFEGNTVTVPYTLSGSDAGNVDQISVVIEKNGWFNLMYYQKLDATPDSNGSVSFELPEGFTPFEWGIIYRIYLIAEDVNGIKETDYAGEPLMIENPGITIDVRNPLQMDQEHSALLGNLAYGQYVGARAGAEGNLEYDVDKDGVYDLIHFDYANGGYLAKSDDCKLRGSYDLADEHHNYKVLRFTFILSDLEVSLDKVSNGTASLTKTSALRGDVIEVTAKPDTGYELDKVTYTPEGGKAVDITDTKSFVMPNSDVKVNVTFKKTAVPTVTATPTAKPTAKPSSNPTAGPASGPIATAIPTAGPTSDPSVTLTLNKDKDSVVCGKTDVLKATLKGATGKITWTSSDPKVAAIDANGKVTAKMAGATTITATAAGKSASCVVTVLYKDVTNSKDFWYAPTNYLTAAGVVKGYDKQTKFKPANECTRAQMVTFIWRLMGEPAPKAKTCKFKDVKKSDYYYKACIWGNENHIVEGYKNGAFGPKIVCARKHAVTFLWRLAGQPAPSSTKNKFKDVKEKDYFYKACLWASEKGILAGYSDGTFKPDGDCLRRQMVTFLYKYDKFINGKV